MIFDGGTFDTDLVEDYLPYYTLDTVIELLQKPLSYSIDAVIGNIVTRPYFLDAVIRKPYNSYQLDALLVMDRLDPRFQESIINAILISHGRVLEDLSATISLMGLRLQLPYATGDDLDQYWSRILNLKRLYLENDEDYRRRLVTRLSIMKSSGTKPECEAILNNILGMHNAVDLQTYWPAEVRVNWTSYTAMRRAEDRYIHVSQALDQMIAAGVSWSTAFPYKTYDMDVNIFGSQVVPYSIDLALSHEKPHYYLLRADIFAQGTLGYDVDVAMQTTYTCSYPLAVRIFSQPSKTLQIDANIEGNVTKNYTLDSVMQENRMKLDQFDAILETNMPKIYNVDGLVERARHGQYILSVEVEA